MRVLGAIARIDVHENHTVRYFTKWELVVILVIRNLLPEVVPLSPCHLAK